MLGRSKRVTYEVPDLIKRLAFLCFSIHLGIYKEADGGFESNQAQAFTLPYYGACACAIMCLFMEECV